MSIHKVHVQGEWYAHAHAMSIASELLRHAQHLEDQANTNNRKIVPTRSQLYLSVLHSVNSRIACLTYIAFALEGYLQLVGQLEIEKNNKSKKDFLCSLRKWDKFTLDCKLNHVCSIFGIKLDKNSDPYFSILKLIEFRNSQAHPKLIRVNKTINCKNSTDVFDDLTIYKHIHPADTERVYEQVRVLVLQIEQARPDGNPDTWLGISTLFVSESL